MRTLTENEIEFVSGGNDGFMAGLVGAVVGGNFGGMTGAVLGVVMGHATLWHLNNPGHMGRMTSVPGLPNPGHTDQKPTPRNQEQRRRNQKQDN